MNIDFIGGSYKGYSSVVNAQRCVNFLPVLDKNGGKKLTLQGTPGLKYFCNFNWTAQNYTTYTEEDAAGRLSAAAAAITLTALNRQDTDTQLYKDFTANYFAGDFYHKLDINISALTSAGVYITTVFFPWAMSNRPGDDFFTHDINNYVYLSLGVYSITATQYQLYLLENSGSASRSSSKSTTLTVGTAYYLTITRDETVGTYGTLYLDIFTDANRTVLLQRLTFSLSIKTDFRYLYGVQSYGAGATSEAASGTVSNLNISDANSSNPVRGLSAEVGGKLYAVVGAAVLEITTAGAITDLGDIDAGTGPVYFADNGTKVMLVDGTDGWTIISSTLAEITDAQFTAITYPTSCAYQDGRFLVTAGTTDDWHISAADDPTSWDDTYESAEGWRDNLLRVMSDGRQVWLFGDESFEVWYNAGLSPSPFARIEGTTRKVGLGARASAAEVQGVFFWFTNNRRAVMTKGYAPQFISTPQIEYLWDNYATVSDAVGFARVQEGHILYTLTFPTQNITWEYDALTDMWHELESSANARWRANCYTYFNGKHYAGDYALSRIYEIDTDTYTDNGQTLTRIRTAQEFEAQGRRIFFGGLEITGETGVGNQAAPGDDPQMTLDWSDDGGRTWSTSISVDWGGYQAYDTRAYFRRLGTARKRIFRITFTEQVKAVITGARLIPKPVIGNY